MEVKYHHTPTLKLGVLPYGVHKAVPPFVLKWRTFTLEKGVAPYA